MLASRSQIDEPPVDQHDADGRRHSLPAGVLHGGDPVVRLGRERVPGECARGGRGTAGLGSAGRPDPGDLDQGGVVSIDAIDL